MPNSGKRSGSARSEHRRRYRATDWRCDPIAVVHAYRSVLLAGGVDPATLSDPQLVAGLREFLQLVIPVPPERADPLAGRAPWRHAAPAMRWTRRSAHLH